MSIVVLLLPLPRVGAAEPPEPTPARARRVFQGLFGPGETDARRPRRLDVMWSVFGAEDDNTFLATDADILDQTLQSRRSYSGATMSLVYTRRPPRNVVRLTATSAVRYYPGLHRIVSTRSGGGIGLDLSPARDWRLQLSANASYSPYYRVVLSAPVAAAGDVTAPSDDYAASKQQSLNYGTALALTHAYGRRASLALDYAASYTQFLGAPDYHAQHGGAHFIYQFARDIGVRLGYGHGSASTGIAGKQPIRDDNIDIGLAYGRSIASSRTAISFSSGSAIVSAEDGRHFRLTGSAQLSRRLSPRWTAALSWGRGLQVPEGATRPFFGDSLVGSVTGYFNQRVTVSLQPTYAHGVVGFAGLTNSYNSVSSTSRVQLALTRQVAMYVDHFYYRYRFATTVGLPPLLTAGVNRQGLRAGLTLWTPLVR